MNGNELSTHAKGVVKEYSEGKLSAEAAGYKLWELKLTLPQEPDPRAGDVILWSRQLGYNIPSESREEADEAADRAIVFFSER